MKIVFVGGIHGVGKSTVVPQLARRLGIPHLEASDLIRRVSSELVDSVKSVEDLAVNQTRLVEGLHDAAFGHSRLLLNGHYCVLRQGGTIAPIPISA